MASYIKRKFFKDPKSLQKQENNICYLADHDSTYWLANKILRIMCIRLYVQDVKESRIFENVMFCFIMFNLILSFVLQSTQLIITVYGGFQIEHIVLMPCIGYISVAILKAIKLKHFKPILQNLVLELRSMWPVGKITEEEHEIIADSLKSLRFVIKAYFTVNVSLCCIYAVVPFISLIKKWTGFGDGQRFLPLLYWFPFDPLQDILFEFIFVFQNYHCFATLGFMLSGDLLFCIFICHITTQFSLLTVKISKMIYVQIDNQLKDSYPLAAYSKEQLLNNNDQGANIREMEENLEEELSNIIHRHRALIRLSEDVENVYTFSLLVNFINSSIIICFCLFCVTFVEKWNEFIYKIFFTTAILQIWIVCWYGQKLIDASTGTGDALYNSGWYMSTNKIKKSVLIMLHRSQKPVCVTTLGFSIVSLASYATILKTSWSYFTLVINMYKG